MKMRHSNYWNNLELEPGYPEVNYKDGILKFTGTCFPENPAQAFVSINNQFDEYFKKNDSLVLIFDFEFINTGTSAQISEMILKLNEFYKAGKKINAIWYYQGVDPDSEENAEFYQNISKFKFKTKKK